MPHAKSEEFTAACSRLTASKVIPSYNKKLALAELGEEPPAVETPMASQASRSLHSWPSKHVIKAAFPEAAP